MPGHHEVIMPEAYQHTLDTWKIAWLVKIDQNCFKILILLAMQKTKLRRLFVHILCQGMQCCMQSLSLDRRRFIDTVFEEN